MDEQERKTLKGSGGYVVANLTDAEIKKAKLGGPDLFLGALGRLDEEKIVKYYCKHCNKEFEGAPEIKHENINQEVAKGYTLSEQGEYLCRQCGSLIAQYKKFVEPSGPQSGSDSGFTSSQYARDGFVAIRKLVGMSVYSGNAYLLGTVKDIGLRDNRTKIVIVISTTEQTEREVPWDQISKIGDIVLLRATEDKVSSGSTKCSKCGFANKPDSKFCEQCGNKLV